ncbi:autophagy protein 5 [Hyalella azteca]|uniref:Autophagy protein 5 n=1 Tax=Hyalella azteca TaxID=294128 RepID=A0A8B7P929_HYAAZ|nr:autophagy protein 5 [Hyalella azteca]
MSMSMSGDREILRRVWEGRVATCIKLAEEDLSSYGEPDPHYLMLPRISYFPLVLEKVRKSFQRHVSPEFRDHEVWLEFDGIPLKMQYPIGVLCDVLNTEGQAPWMLRLHFSSPPASLISLPSRESMESQFLSCLKEADALKHRGAVMGALQSREHKQLWQGLVNDKFDELQHYFLACFPTNLMNL